MALLQHFARHHEQISSKCIMLQCIFLVRSLSKAHVITSESMIMLPEEDQIHVPHAAQALFPSLAGVASLPAAETGSTIFGQRPSSRPAAYFPPSQQQVTTSMPVTTSMTDLPSQPQVTASMLVSDLMPGLPSQPQVTTNMAATTATPGLPFQSQRIPNIPAMASVAGLPALTSPMNSGKLKPSPTPEPVHPADLMDSKPSLVISVPSGEQEHAARAPTCCPSQPLTSIIRPDLQASSVLHAASNPPVECRATLASADAPQPSSNGTLTEHRTRTGNGVSSVVMTTESMGRSPPQASLLLSHQLQRKPQSALALSPDVALLLSRQQSRQIFGTAGMHRPRQFVGHDGFNQWSCDAP
jgi:hypothetical protein